MAKSQNVCLKKNGFNQFSLSTELVELLKNFIKAQNVRSNCLAAFSMVYLPRTQIVTKPKKNLKGERV